MFINYKYSVSLIACIYLSKHSVDIALTVLSVSWRETIYIYIFCEKLFIYIYIYILLYESDV